MKILWRVRRSLMFRAEDVWDRWATIRNAEGFASVGEGAEIYGRADITGRERIELGDHVRIGKGSFIRGHGGLTIGAHTSISKNVVIYTYDHDIHSSTLPYDDAVVYRPVSIGRNVWIGMNVCIAPGTTIGDGAIIGMGTVVSGTVPPMAIVVSAPWRIVGERDEAHYQDLEAQGRNRVAPTRTSRARSAELTSTLGTPDGGGSSEAPPDEPSAAVEGSHDHARAPRPLMHPRRSPSTPFEPEGAPVPSSTVLTGPGLPPTLSTRT